MGHPPVMSWWGLGMVRRSIKQNWVVNMHQECKSKCWESCHTAKWPKDCMVMKICEDVAGLVESYKSSCWWFFIVRPPQPVSVPHPKKKPDAVAPHLGNPMMNRAFWDGLSESLAIKGVGDGLWQVNPTCFFAAKVLDDLHSFHWKWTQVLVQQWIRAQNHCCGNLPV